MIFIAEKFEEEKWFKKILNKSSLAPTFRGILNPSPVIRMFRPNPIQQKNKTSAFMKTVFDPKHIFYGCTLNIIRKLYIILCGQEVLSTSTWSAY